MSQMIVVLLGATIATEIVGWVVRHRIERAHAERVGQLTRSLDAYTRELAAARASLEDHEPQLLAVGLQLPPCPVGGAS